jgi:hypothetical protein
MNTYYDNKAELLLCIIDEDNIEEAKQKASALVSLIQRYDKVTALIDICIIPSKDEEKIISEADIYVTNRDMSTLSRVAMADKYGVKVVSGVDIPIF